MEYSWELTGMSWDIIMRNETGNITKVGWPRLEEQWKKQEFFSMTHDNIHFFVPPILSKGYLDETRYQIIMPYIQGNLLTSLLLSSSDAHIIRSYAQRVFGVLQYFWSSHLSYEKTVHNASYHSHLLTILDQKSEKLSLSKRVVHLFRDKLEGIDTDSGNASFLCHGDLHLDNMIIWEDEKVCYRFSV